MPGSRCRTAAKTIRPRSCFQIILLFSGFVRLYLFFSIEYRKRIFLQNRLPFLPASKTSAVLTALRAGAVPRRLYAELRRNRSSAAIRKRRDSAAVETGRRRSLDRQEGWPGLRQNCSIQNVSRPRKQFALYESEDFFQRLAHFGANLVARGIADGDDGGKLFFFGNV